MYTSTHTRITVMAPTEDDPLVVDMLVEAMHGPLQVLEQSTNTIRLPRPTILLPLILPLLSSLVHKAMAMRLRPMRSLTLDTRKDRAVAMHSPNMRIQYHLPTNLNPQCISMVLIVMAVPRVLAREHHVSASRL
jgi:hypothetical protein